VARFRAAGQDAAAKQTHSPCELSRHQRHVQVVLTQIYSLLKLDPYLESLPYHSASWALCSAAPRIRGRWQSAALEQPPRQASLSDFRNMSMALLSGFTAFGAIRGPHSPAFTSAPRSFTSSTARGHGPPTSCHMPLVPSKLLTHATHVSYTSLLPLREPLSLLPRRHSP
jgi:hypothetical protein